jgi:hypothetical protein
VKLQPADQKPHIDTVISPDDGHMVARNMKKREINPYPANVENKVSS